MKKARSFSDKFRYTRGAEEHDKNCECGQCVSFLQFTKERLYGAALTQRGIVFGEAVEIFTRGEK
jgi:hypothetical protein